MPPSFLDIIMDGKIDVVQVQVQVEAGHIMYFLFFLVYSSAVGPYWCTQDKQCYRAGTFG